MRLAVCWPKSEWFLLCWVFAYLLKNLCTARAALIFCTPNGREEKKCKYVQIYMCVYPSSSFNRDVPFVYEMSITVLKHTKNRPELFVPLSALVSYSQTPGSFAEPLIPFSHVPQIKITYLVLTDVCSGAPLLWTPLIETINSRCAVHLHRKTSVIVMAKNKKNQLWRTAGIYVAWRWEKPCFSTPNL